MTFIGDTSEFSEQKSYPLIIHDKKLLLIHHDNHYCLIENKCGHFGVPLIDAQVKNNLIICAQHGISFNLETGQVINRPYENCDPIKIYTIKNKNGALYSLNL